MVSLDSYFFHNGIWKLMLFLPLLLLQLLLPGRSSELILLFQVAATASRKSPRQLDAVLANTATLHPESLPSETRSPDAVQGLGAPHL
jgi:hypothetical protein